jgi:predicted ribosome quality control (RQC) complex YloA/Tae2 family protein
MKDGMSSFDIAKMVAELQILVGGHLDKAYQLARDKLLIRVNLPKEGKKDLVMVVGKWIYLATQKPQTPKTPTSFAMLLRKYLSNGTITKIEQHGFDRIIVINIRKAEEFQIIAELFREGNVVLIKEGNIIQPLIPKSWSQREVRAHRTYEYPPSRVDFKTLDIDSLKKILSDSKKDVVRTLASDVNIGGLYAEELCLLSGISKEKKTKDLSEEEKNLIFGNMQNLLSQLSESKESVLVIEDSVPFNITPFPLKRHESYESEKYESLSLVIEKYLETKKEKEPLDLEYENARDRIERQKVQQEKAIANQEKKAKRDKIVAELIYAHYQECLEILSTLKSAHERKNIQEIIPELKEKKSFRQLDLAKSEVLLALLDEDQNEFEVSLNFKKSLEENAGIYYDKAKKAKEKLEGARKSLAETHNKLSKIKIEKEDKKKRKKRETKKFWFDKYRWFISSDGNIVVAGRDARTNDKVVKKYLTERDRYAHAEIHGAPSVVIKHKDGEISEQTLYQACEFALVHSKAWNAKIGSGTAYWVTPDQVSKTPPAGEFIPRGAFIIRGRRNYIQNIELKMAVGLIQFEDTEKVMCAPEGALVAQSQSYIVFGPGEMKKSDFVKRVCGVFDLEQEEVAGILPPGNIKVLRTIGIPEGTF